MDEQRFDDLSKKLATSVSRRQAVKILGATAAGGLGALFGARGAFAHHHAQCRDTGANCRSNAECCSGVCVNFHCACPPGQVLCPGSGECVQACFPPKVFNPATCDCECPTGTSTCGEFTCCPPAEACCSGQGFEFCCPPDTTCCIGPGFVDCCPPGFQCDQQFGCQPLGCQTPGSPCFFDQDCGQNCTCFGADPFLGILGFCG